MLQGDNAEQSAIQNPQSAIIRSAGMKLAKRVGTTRFCTLLVVICTLLFVSSVEARQGGGGVSRIRLGNSADATPALRGPSLFLQGNGAPRTDAFQNHIAQVASTPLDIVVLAASSPSSGSLTPECDDLIGLANVNSCETITITTAKSANNSGAASAVSQAEIVYFAGGNQCNYVGWRGSAVYSAVQGVVSRGGGVGGGSAGLAIQGDFVYDSCSGSVTSSEALGNPYHRYISFTYDFFNWPFLENVITDSHFVERDRMGRLMAFVARQVQDGKTSAAYGLGVDQDTTVLIDSSGLGRVYGGSAYVVLGDHTPERCVSRRSLTFSNFKIWKLTNGSTYDFANRPSSGYYLRSVNNGVISSNPYN
jgi:cyanophycinase-like exopeptidase